MEVLLQKSSVTGICAVSPAEEAVLMRDRHKTSKQMRMGALGKEV